MTTCQSKFYTHFTKYVWTVKEVKKLPSKICKIESGTSIKKS